MTDNQEYEIKYINNEIEKISGRKMKLSYMKDAFMVINFTSFILMATSCSSISSIQSSPNLHGSLAAYIASFIVMLYLDEESKECKKEIEELIQKEKVLKRN